jgi:ribonuclease R
MNKKEIRELENMCEHISKREINAAKAERDSIKYKQSEYLSDKVGSVFQGIVSGITEWGIYVELIENKCEGLIRYNSFDTEYHADVDNYVAYNDYGSKIRLGDVVMVVIKSVNVEKKQIDFKLF